MQPRAGTRPISKRSDLAHVLAPWLALGLAWWLALARLPVLIWAGVIVYGLAQLLLIRQEHLLEDDSTEGARLPDWLYMVLDALFALLLLSQSRVLLDAFYPLYMLIGLRVLSAYQRLPITTLIPFLLGLIHVLSNQSIRSGEPETRAAQISEAVLVLSSLGFGAVAIWTGAVQQRANIALRQELLAVQAGRDARVGELERSVSDLRARLREIYTLEEGLRVITSTLSLDEVLNQIVDSTVQMLDPARVYGMALSLEGEAGFTHHSFTAAGSASEPWSDLLARRAMRQQVPLIIGDVETDAELSHLAPAGLRSVLCVPLFVGTGAPRGALTVVSGALAAFASTDARHLTALASQAGIAIQNAEMHARLRRQQRLLEAVVRDINDGLVVVDAQSQVVLTNPIGRYLLNKATATLPVHSHLVELAATMRSEGKATRSCELRLIGEADEVEGFYQGFASQVSYDESEEPLIAIVLHDITAQKVEERARNEFISMVSHELRNPLNSINGFIKVVLQRRAGELTPLQDEFLQIADSQTEQLKGRIAELLEFNRLEAGRLALNPQWNDLALLVAGTVARLRLQAEQAGLTLSNAIQHDLPECRFDSERIGQVLTNLIENAIKATDAGGAITLSAELHEHEVWVSVSDTGVGIPAEEQGKIFQRFYRAHDRTSSHGNHLGLGLAICQQIIEGHSGRIWVESQEHVGSRFTFALPLIEREMVVNDWTS